MLVLAFSAVGFLKGILLFTFLLSALLLTLVVLLQEPKGGGLSSAFGGAGAETFGVETGGVNRFTSIVAGTWMACAILYAAIPPDTVDRSHTDAVRTAPAEPPPGVSSPTDEGEGNAPAGNGGDTQPPGDGGDR